MSITAVCPHVHGANILVKTDLEEYYFMILEIYFEPNKT